jgi:hypothetical protein
MSFNMYQISESDSKIPPINNERQHIDQSLSTERSKGVSKGLFRHLQPTEKNIKKMKNKEKVLLKNNKTNIYQKRPDDYKLQKSFMIVKPLNLSSMT